MSDGKVIHFPGARQPATGDDRTSASDTHYEIALDDEPPPGPPQPVDPVPQKPADGVLQPVFPPPLQRGNIGPAAKRALRRNRHRIAYHGIRLPLYIADSVRWAVVGLFKLVGKLVGDYWLLRDAKVLKEAALQSNPIDQLAWEAAHRKQLEVRARRGYVLLTGLLAVLALFGAAYWQAGWWGVGILAALAVPPLAHYGHPPGKPIISAAYIAPRYRRLSADIVLRAYEVAGLSKPDEPLTFASGMARDGNGSSVVVDLYYGRTFEQAVAAKGKIASGMDVSVNQVFLIRDRTSERRHELYVADEDPLAADAGRTPHLRLRQANIWASAPFGIDERGRPVSVSMTWNSILIGAQSRMGKTFAARALALHAALDPHVKLTVADGKAAPDWRKFALVADRYVFGIKINRDGDPVEMLIDALREVKADVQVRNEHLSDLPVDICPEGKLTPEIARDLRFRMPVRLIVMEELQEYLDGSIDQTAAKEIANLMVFLVKVAPSVGVIVLSSTQKPSGIGSGDVGRLFTAYRDSHQIRFALKCANHHVSAAVLGDGHAAEFDASALPIGDDYKGVGILYGASTHTSIVRTYLADGVDAEKILTAARALRERAGTLSGYAIGETAAREVRDVLADARDVFLTGEPGLHWETIAQRMAEQMPAYYADLTRDTISAQLRDLGVPSEDIKRDGRTLKGAKLHRITEAMVRRGHDER